MDIVWLVIIGTSIWVYFDSKSIGVKKGLNPGFLDLGPIGWMLATLLLWIIAFPAYLGTRGKLKKLGQANQLEESTK